MTLLNFAEKMDGPGSETSQPAVRFLTKAMELPMVPTITGKEQPVVITITGNELPMLPTITGKELSVVPTITGKELPMIPNRNGARIKYKLMGVMVYF
jgi:hypothetical protein